ncbi:cytochrome P450 [Nocardia sp. BMG111209]|uniref:cytochrome P450 n=1 Tax=Nocardia sp. BMG111209 TaxID=1160137 RepID=UPI0003AA3B0B|nr:cytochrome P450 [Nocardia sp. BMG111209]
MTTATSTPNDSPDLPVIPAPRAASCPLAPPPEFAAWRESGRPRRALFQRRPTWVISRYHDIRAALVDPRLSADTIRDVVKAAMSTGEEPSPADGLPVIFPRIDDPEHNRLRRMMTAEFTVRRVEAMRPRIQELVDRFLDEMISQGPPADLVRDFALPVPSLVVCLLLGVPYNDHEFFQKHSIAGLDSRSDDDQRVTAVGALYNYMFELVARKEREPGDDLMSRLITDYVATGKLGRETAAVNGMILLQAGHETTASMISLGTLALLEHPDHLERLRRTDDPATAAGTIEELLRYLTIVHSLVERVALEDLTIGGQQIRAGELVLMNLPAGNWDPAFVDNPDILDTDRDSRTRQHLGFGYGTHQCIGQNLARAELQIALVSLARRLPGLRLAVPSEELRFRNTQEIYGVEALPVTW